MISPAKFLTIFFMLCALYCKAQNSGNLLAKVNYTLKHVRDSSKRDSMYTENMILYLGKNQSMFTSYDRVLQIEAIEKDLEKQRQVWTGPGLPKFKQLPGTRKTSTQTLFIFQDEKKIFIKEYLMKDYLYEEPFDEINWSLTSETKSFDKIIAQKAMAKFKGRDWVAWFAPEIPFEAGPWKLCGLPGLIIEAYDVKKEVQFLFSGFETLKQVEQDKIELPKNVEKVRLADIKKLKETMYKNPRAFYMAQIEVSKGILDAKEFESLSFKKVNNPIELPENK